MSRRNMPRVYIHGKHNRAYYWNTAVKILNEHYPDQAYGGRVTPRSWKFGPPQPARKDHMAGDAGVIVGAAKNMVKISYVSKEDYVTQTGSTRQRSKKCLKQHGANNKNRRTVHIRDLPKDVAREVKRLYKGNGKTIDISDSPILKLYFEGRE